MKERRLILFAVACFLLAVLGQGALILLVFALGWDYLPPRPLWPMPWPWIVNGAWLLIFALQHSGMARMGFKNRLERYLPSRNHRPLYVGLSGLAMLGLALTWQPLPGEPVWEGPRGISAIAILGLLGMIACSFCFDFRDFFGLEQARTGDLSTSPVLLVTGPYRYVRHPLMLMTLVALWGHAVMPITLLFLSGGLTLYILLALRLEERDLHQTFGPDYEAYRQRVPALIPYRRPLAQ